MPKEWWELIPTTDNPPRSEPESSGTRTPSKGGADEQDIRGEDEEPQQNGELEDEEPGGKAGVDPDFDDLESIFYYAPVALLACIVAVWYFQSRVSARASHIYAN